MRAYSLLLLGVLLVLGGCGSGGGTTTSPGSGAWIVHGVVESSGLPAGVTVYLEGDLDRTALTDAAGRFRFEGVPNGRYRVVPIQGGSDFDPDYYDLVIAGKQPGPLGFEKGDLTDAQAPKDRIRLVLVHHETGDVWLDPHEGNLGANLANQNYYVRNVTYGWDAPENTDIGDRTDVGEYWTWFRDAAVQGNGMARRDNITAALYATDVRSGRYPSDLADPGGENDVILLMSPPLNNAIQEDRGATVQDLQGERAVVAAHTLSNCKAVYVDMLEYFRSRPDKLFVVITAPPLVEAMTTPAEAVNARTLNDWLVYEWLETGGWANRNVYVWDLFNVLTDGDNHHRYASGRLVHEQVGFSNTAAYATSPTDSLPNATGSFKATADFVSVLNVFHNRWRHWRTMK